MTEAEYSLLPFTVVGASMELNLGGKYLIHYYIGDFLYPFSLLVSNEEIFTNIAAVV